MAHATRLLFVLMSIGGLSEITAQTNSTQDPQWQRQVSSEISSLKEQLENQRREIQQQFQLMFEMLKVSSTSLSLSRSKRSVDVKPLPRDCSDLLASDVKTSGVYTVYVGRIQRPVQVYCDMKTDGGGWTVIQKRQDGTENFYRPWIDYANGFGNVAAEFWLANGIPYSECNAFRDTGNDVIHWMTNSRNYRLRFDLGDWYGNFRHAEYNNFKVGSGCEKYRLISLGEYCGTAGDSFLYHLGQKFSTLDQDNDSYGPSHCAQASRGGWWYNACWGTGSNINGLYLRGPYSTPAYTGVAWYSWTGYYYSLEITEMKIRPNDM